VVRVDGAPLVGPLRQAWRSRVAYVQQEAILLDGTIRDNLVHANPGAGPAQVEAALQQAAAEFVHRLPKGIDTPIGDGGTRLSGGERQRIALARALIREPALLILDEATSALDAATEMKVQAALDEVMRERTTFVIAHRLSTVRNATRILMFDHGRIVESGSFDELIRKGGAFAELAKAQFLLTKVPEATPEPIAAAEPATKQPKQNDEPHGIVVPPPNRITGDAAE